MLLLQPQSINDDSGMFLDEFTSELPNGYEAVHADEALEYFHPVEEGGEVAEYWVREDELQPHTVYLFPADGEEDTRTAQDFTAAFLDGNDEVITASAAEIPCHVQVAWHREKAETQAYKGFTYGVQHRYEEAQAVADAVDNVSLDEAAWEEIREAAERQAQQWGLA